MANKFEDIIYNIVSEKIQNLDDINQFTDVCEKMLSHINDEDLTEQSQVFANYINMVGLDLSTIIHIRGSLLYSNKSWYDQEDKNVIENLQQIDTKNFSDAQKLIVSFIITNKTLDFEGFNDINDTEMLEEDKLNQFITQYNLVLQDKKLSDALKLIYMNDLDEYFKDNSYSFEIISDINNAFTDTKNIEQFQFVASKQFFIKLSNILNSDESTNEQLITLINAIQPLNNIDNIDKAAKDLIDTAKENEDIEVNDKHVKLTEYIQLTIDKEKPEEKEIENAKKQVVSTIQSIIDTSIQSSNVIDTINNTINNTIRIFIDKNNIKELSISEIITGFSNNLSVNILGGIMSNNKESVAKLIYTDIDEYAKLLDSNARLKTFDNNDDYVKVFTEMNVLTKNEKTDITDYLNNITEAGNIDITYQAIVKTLENNPAKNISAYYTAKYMIFAQP